MHPRLDLNIDFLQRNHCSSCVYCTGKRVSQLVVAGDSFGLAWLLGLGVRFDEIANTSPSLIMKVAEVKMNIRRLHISRPLLEN